MSGRWTLVKDTGSSTGTTRSWASALRRSPRRAATTSGPRSKRLKISHTAPLTVAAELGIAGILLYLAFLVGAFLFFWRLRRDDDALGLALLGVLTVLFVHSLSYGVFFEDPLLWVALGVGAAAALAASDVGPPRRP